MVICEPVKVARSTVYLFPQSDLPQYSIGNLTEYKFLSGRLLRFNPAPKGYQNRSTCRHPICGMYYLNTELD